MDATYTLIKLFVVYLKKQTKKQMFPVTSMRPWTSPLPSVNLRFPSCKMGVSKRPSSWISMTLHPHSSLEAVPILRGGR